MLVNDLATLTLAEGGALRLHREPIDVAVLVNETSGAPSLRRRGLPVSNSRNMSMPAFPALDADPGRIRGVLAISSVTRSPTSDRVAPFASKAWGLADRWSSPFATMEPAFPRTCSHASSIDSSRGPRQPDRGSDLPSSGMSSRPTAARSAPRAR